MLPESFHFLRPEWLLAAPLIVPLVWLARRGAAAASAWRRVCDPELFEHLVAREGGRAPRWPLFALVAGWVVSSVALAGPAWERLPQPSFASPTSTVLVLNLSRSMDATDVAPSRLGRARFELLDALAARGDERLGLVIFSEEPYTVTPLCDDPSVIAAQVPVLATNLMPGRGTRVDRAIDHASELLSRAGAVSGRILLVSDGAGDDPSSAADAAARAASAGHPVSVLAVGTEQGGPLPGRRGFERDALGNPIVVKLDRGALEAVARAGHGRFAEARPDDVDLETVMPAVEPLPGFTGELSATSVRADTWRDMGAWLLIVPLVLAPFAFRRGWASALALLALCGIPMSAPAPAQAAGLAEWFSRPDQQGAKAFAEGRPADAAKLFEDPAWRAAALYRAQDYPGAAEALQDQKGPEARYNLGNALARSGRLEEAIAAYDETLAAVPEHADARFNRDLVAKLLEQQKRQQKQDEQSNQGGKQQDSQQKQDPQSQGQQGSQDSQQQGEESQQQGSADPSDAQKQGSQDARDEESAKSKAGQGQQQEQPQPSDQSRDPAQAAADTAGDTSSKPGDGEAAANESSGPRNERELALERWLARITDDPGGLLREKLRREYAKRRYESR
jgi:Ca-activated chloride channel family protein